MAQPEAEKKPFERLPVDVVPLNYKLELNPDLKAFTFQGKLETTVQVLGGCNAPWLTVVISPCVLVCIYTGGTDCISVPYALYTVQVAQTASVFPYALYTVQMAKCFLMQYRWQSVSSCSTGGSVSLCVFPYIAVTVFCCR